MVNNTYFPFGLGRHACPGRNLAIAGMHSTPSPRTYADGKVDRWSCVLRVEIKMIGVPCYRRSIASDWFNHRLVVVVICVYKETRTEVNSLVKCLGLSFRFSHAPE